MKNYILVIFLFLVISSCGKRYIVEGVQFWKKGDVENYTYKVTTISEVTDSLLLIKSVPILGLEDYHTIMFSDNTGFLYAILDLNIDRNGYYYTQYNKVSTGLNQEKNISGNYESINSVINDGSKCAIISEYFVKSKMKYPRETKIRTRTHIHEVESGQAVILNKFVTKNAFGVESEYVYKIWMVFKGGEWTDINNWKYTDLIIENTSTREQYKY